MSDLETLELETLEKELKKRKRIASEWAMKLHDLAEEGLPAAYEQLPQLAESTFEACAAWRQAQQAWLAAQR